MVLGENTPLVPDDEGVDKTSAVCVISDTIKGEGESRTIKVVSTTTGLKLLHIVGCAFNYEPNDLVLTLQKDLKNVVINDHPSSTVEQIGLICDGMSENFFDIRMKNTLGKFGRSQTTCTTETVEIQKSSRGSRFVEKTCTTSIVKTSSSSERSPSGRQLSHSFESAFTENSKVLPSWHRRHIGTNDSEMRDPLRMMHKLLLDGHTVSDNISRRKSPELNRKETVINVSPASEKEEGVRHQVVLEDGVSGSRSEEISGKVSPVLNKLIVEPEVVCVGDHGDSKEETSPALQRERELEISNAASDSARFKTDETYAKGDLEVVLDDEKDADIESEPVPSLESVPASEPSVEISLSEPREPGCYVGLVNQAMTCYLNSLLQTLYMTPEFRNALYRWEFDSKKEEGVKNIPFQLQKLFLQLQMSKKSAIGTTELTTSFGWDSNEAWQQHDVQELCRVMFDALEQRFAKTDQADLISCLYEGKMKDYVKCLECSYESAREDTFLDVPLVVRPFGSTQAYGSVEEALRAFVAPETLVESNQYFCDRCSKKCDAHKGLKFVKFPYLLTLHLKRFDFDPFTMHRIKLNDKVTFPQVLNLNEFILSESETLDIGKSDIMMDSGSGFDEEASYKGSSTPSRDDEGEIMDIDEGIDVSSNGNHELSADEKYLNGSAERFPGPFIYELFSIMVHSGSANGGHYYAYIKSFTEGNWYCFNDVQVTKITHDDIRRTYGGGNTRGNYSSAYSSSANAYMLMYRQIDKECNAVPIKPCEFPPHIRRLLVVVEEMEKKEQEQIELEKAMCKIKLFCSHPMHKMMTDRRLVIHKNCTLEEATGTAYELLGLNGVVPLNCCRLVKYDAYHDSVESSLKDSVGLTVGEVLGGVQTSYNFDLLLEIRKPDEEFVNYQPGGITVKLHVVDLENEELSSPLTLRSLHMQTVEELKQQIAKKLDLPSSEMRLVLEKCHDLYLLKSPEESLASEGFSKRNKVFVEHKDVDDATVPFKDSKFHRILDVHEHLITVLVSLPKVDKDALVSLGIDACGDQVEKNGSVMELESEGEVKDFLEKTVKNGQHDSECNHEPRENGPCETLPIQSAVKANNGDHSENSSLSSLTDSERTLVGDEASPRNNSPVMEEEYWDSPPTAGFNGWGNAGDGCRGDNKIFFKAKHTDDSKCSLDVCVDARISLGELKKHLEPFVGVGSDYFKLYRIYSNKQEFECTRLTDNMMSYGDNATLAVKLGKALQKGEYRVKVYQLLVNEPEPSRHLVDWVLTKGMTVRCAKKALLPELISKSGVEIPLNRCRLRKKNWKNPGSIFLDTQKFEDDIPIYPNWEVFLEVLPEPERVTGASQLSVFLRTWHPATLQLTPLAEMVLNEQTFEELQLKSSEVSGISVENIEFTKGVGTFPCEMYPLTMQTEMEWHSNVNNLNSWPFYVTEDGCVLCCRDRTEVMKELTEEEKKLLSTKESSRYTKTASKPYFSPHKEKALKIYTVGAPPVAARNDDVEGGEEEDHHRPREGRIYT